jgi:predicted MFS family arabinose efflux permease
MSLEILSLIFISRLVMATSNRLFMPFIPQLSTGLGMTITTLSWLLALRTFTGLISPIVGVLADRFGRRIILIIALIFQGIGLIGFGFSAGWWSVIPLMVISLSTTAYLPIQKAYISDIVSYERRGRALAAVDASFSTAGIVGLPLVGWMIEISGWQLPFYVLGGLSILSALVIGIRLPKTKRETPSTPIAQNMTMLLRQPRISATVAIAFLLLFIFFVFMMFWPLWLSDHFGFGPLQIGLFATSIGIAEFAGLFLAGMIIDRIGKRRGTFIGLVACVILLLIMPIFQDTLAAVQILVVLFAIAIEFAITAAVPLFAEQAPEARATVFSLVTFGNTIGVGLAPPAATILWTWRGLNAILIVGGICSLLAIFLIWKFLHDQPATSQEIPLP